MIRSLAAAGASFFRIMLMLTRRIQSAARRMPRKPNPPISPSGSDSRLLAPPMIPSTPAKRPGTASQRQSTPVRRITREEARRSGASASAIVAKETWSRYTRVRMVASSPSSTTPKLKARAPQKTLAVAPMIRKRRPPAKATRDQTAAPPSAAASRPRRLARKGRKKSMNARPTM